MVEHAPVYLEPSPSEEWRPRVLLVDDDPRSLSALERALRHEPYRLLLADDPLRAEEWIKSRNIHLLITDEFMPGLLGTELLEVVQRYSPQTATILVTGYPNPVVAYRGFQGRMGLLLPKPWEGEALRAASLRLLSERVPRGAHRASGAGGVAGDGADHAPRRAPAADRP